MNITESRRRFMPLMDADGNAGGGNPADPKENEEKTEEEPEEKPKNDKKSKDSQGEKKYSDKDLDDIIGKKFAKWKADEEKKIKEAEKLAGMSAAEKAEHQMQEALRRAEEAEAKLSHLSMTKEARVILQEKSINLSDDLLEVLVGEDAETTKSNIDSFAELFQKAVDAEVKKQLKGKTPKTGAGKTKMTKAEITAIKDPIARREAIAENITLFE